MVVGQKQDEKGGENDDEEINWCYTYISNWWYFLHETYSYGDDDEDYDDWDDDYDEDEDEEVEKIQCLNLDRLIF